MEKTKVLVVHGVVTVLRIHQLGIVVFRFLLCREPPDDPHCVSQVK